MAGRVLACTLALSIACANAWVSTSQYHLDQAAVPLSTFKEREGAINRLWDFPVNSASNHGLGGGITYAWDPALCTVLQPSFSEDMLGTGFASCEAIASSMRRAFTSWSSNHPRLKFFDVSLDCHLDRIRTGNTHDRCRSAEIWITTGSNTSGDDAAATTTVQYGWNTDFHHTNGARAQAGVWEAVQADITFTTTGMCWYLDATFCGRFHSLKAQMGVEKALLMWRFIIFGVWGIAVAELFWQLQKCGRKQAHLLALAPRPEKLLAMAADAAEDAFSEATAMDWSELFKSG